MRTFAVLLDTCTDRFSRLLFVCGGIVLLLVLGLTLAHIVLRAMGHPMRGVIEISGYLSAAAIGLCLPQAQQTGSHIETGMLNERLPHGIRRLIRLAVTLICIAFMMLLAAETVDFALFVREGEELIDGWTFSYDTMIFALALGCAGQALIQINDLVQLGAHVLSVHRAKHAGLTACQLGGGVQ